VANYKEIEEGKVEFEYLSETSLSKKFKNIQRGFKSYFYEEYLYQLINDYRDLMGRDTWYKGKEISVYQNPVEINNIEKNRFAVVLPSFEDIKIFNEINNFKIINFYCTFRDLKEIDSNEFETHIIDDKVFLNKEVLPNYSCHITQYLEYLFKFRDLSLIKASKFIFPTAIPLGGQCSKNHWINFECIGVHLQGNCEKCNKKTDKSFYGGELKYILFKDKEYQFPTHSDGPNFLCNECQTSFIWEDIETPGF